MESVQIAVDTYVFALVATAVGVVVALWLTSTLTRRVRALESSLATGEKRLVSYGSSWNGALTLIRERLDKLEKAAPVVLAAKVDELSEAVGKLAETHRRFAGRMDRRYQLSRDDAPPAEDSDDPTWLALRAAQTRSTGTPPNGGT
jgi:hypothetical protein